MIFPTEQSLTDFATRLGSLLTRQRLPLCLELIGDVGAGKTTFTRALARGLGVQEPVTSPSFTISKRYSVKDITLIHYDFYRLPDPGLMSADLAEALASPNTLVVTEWADTVADLLPSDHLAITFQTLADGSRKLTFNQPMEKLYGTLS